jgi:hypothetical protein
MYAVRTSGLSADRITTFAAGTIRTPEPSSRRMGRNPRDSGPFPRQAILDPEGRSISGYIRL